MRGKAALLSVCSWAESGERGFERIRSPPCRPARPTACRPLWEWCQRRGFAARLVPFAPRARGGREEAAAQPQPSQCPAADLPPLPPAGWRRPAATRGAAERAAAGRAVARGASSRLSLPPVRPRPSRHVAAAAGAAAVARPAAGVYGACTARSSVPQTRTLASGCSLHQVTQRRSEVGKALPQRRSLILHCAPLALAVLARIAAGPGRRSGRRRVPFSEGWGRSLGCCVQPAPDLVW